MDCPPLESLEEQIHSVYREKVHFEYVYLQLTRQKSLLEMCSVFKEERRWCLHSVLKLYVYIPGRRIEGVE